MRLHGCDVNEGRYAASFDFVGLAYRRLDHPYRLPYPDETFDTVIASGVLEHVADDGESMKELYRVLKTNGRLLITFLPNRLSYTEFACRTLGLMHHRRLYSRSRLRRMLLHRGFWPLRIRYHQLTPGLIAKANRFGPFGGAAMWLVERAFLANRVLEALWPISALASNIWAAAEKRRSM